MKRICDALAALLIALAVAPRLDAQTASAPLPVYLTDRGAGVGTSMFGTYIGRGELLVYPFFEYYRDDDLEYAPEEFGFVGEDDFRGRYRAKETLLFLAYGLTDDLAIEFEAAATDATFEKSPDDPSPLPSKIEESGLGDIEAQLRWRWQRENDRRPELFSYAEVVFPHHKEKALIGTPGWELKLGTGATRGFRWGTLTVRGAIEFDSASSSKFDLGEYAVEYLKRVSPAWRFYLGVEGTQDEVALITEVQWHITPRVVIKLNNGFGLTSKAIDRAPEVGILFRIPTR